MHLQMMRTSTNKLTWTKMNTEPSSPSSPFQHLISIFPFLLCPHFVLYSLHAFYKYSPSSLLSVCLFLSFSYVYLLVTDPLRPLAVFIAIHNSSSAAPPCLHLHSNNNSNVPHPSYFSMSNAENRAEPGMEVVNSEFRSVNISSIFDFSERTNVFLLILGVIYLPLVRC